MFALQANQTVDSYTTLRTLTDGSRSYSFRTPLQMRRFIDAGLTYCRTYPTDVAFVLRCLGSSETAGLQRLGEICRFPHTVTVCGLVPIGCLAKLPG